MDTTNVVSIAIPANMKGEDVDGNTLYHDVQLTQCLEALLGSEGLDYACPSCARNVQAVKFVSSSLASGIVLIWCLGD